MGVFDRPDPFKQRQPGIPKIDSSEHVILQKVIEELLQDTQIEALALSDKLGISPDLAMITMEVARRRLEGETRRMEMHLAEDADER